MTKIFKKSTTVTPLVKFTLQTHQNAIVWNICKNFMESTSAHPLMKMTLWMQKSAIFGYIPSMCPKNYTTNVTKLYCWVYVQKGYKKYTDATKCHFWLYVRKSYKTFSITTYHENYNTDAKKCHFWVHVRKGYKK